MGLAADVFARVGSVEASKLGFDLDGLRLAFLLRGERNVDRRNSGQINYKYPFHWKSPVKCDASLHESAGADK